MASQPHHRTPLRRVSQGSLFALSRSNAYPDAPEGLGFIEPAMAEIADEMDVLHSNVEGIKNLGESLSTFNESFASWLYVMSMNSLTTDWPQAPTEASFLLARRRAEQDALRAMEALKAAQAKEAAEREAARAAAAAAAEDKTLASEYGDAETTYTANATTISATSSSKTSGAVKKKGGKPKLTAKEKKERSIELERIIMALPLEFRGSDPGLRKNMESVIEGLMDAPGQTVKLFDLIKAPDLNQARVNKCLIALVNRKVVKKDNSTGTVLYRWQGLP